MLLKFVSEGTRVQLLQGTRLTGVVTQVREEPYLKPYVVLCDDGTRIFASACDLALEGDPERTPLGPALIRE